MKIHINTKVSTILIVLDSKIDVDRGIMKISNRNTFEAVRYGNKYDYVINISIKKSEVLDIVGSGIPNDIFGYDVTIVNKRTNVTKIGDVISCGNYSIDIEVPNVVYKNNPIGNMLFILHKDF